MPPPPAGIVAVICDWDLSGGGRWRIGEKDTVEMNLPVDFDETFREVADGMSRDTLGGGGKGAR